MKMMNNHAKLPSMQTAKINYIHKWIGEKVLLSYGLACFYLLGCTMMFNTSCYTVVQISKNWTDAKVRYE